MERKLEVWRAGGLDVWQVIEEQRSGWQEGRFVKAAKQPGSYAAKFDIGEIQQEQHLDTAYPSIRLFAYSQNGNNHLSIPLALHTSLLTVILALFLTFLPAFAEEMPMSTLVTPTNVEFKLCTRNYILPEEKLFYMAIASARANNFEVNEIQSKTGYILFTAAGKQYLASVINVDEKNSMLKITPVNNNYFFAPGIVLNFFRYIDLNGATPIVDLPKV